MIRGCGVRAVVRDRREMKQSRKLFHELFPKKLTNMREKKIPAQDHRPKKNSCTYSGLEKKILAICSLC